VKDFDAEEFRRKLCTCGPPPEECVTDDTVLIRYYSDSRADTAFKPRAELETAVSVLMAEGWSAEQVIGYVRKGAPVTRAMVEKATLLTTTARKLRKNGFAVVHTCGRIDKGPHVSVVWPADRPFETQQSDWPPEVSAGFEACFNGEEETTDEPGRAGQDG
jgi:hypothetical protein